MLVVTTFGQNHEAIQAASASGSSAACTTTSEVTARVRQTYSRRRPVTSIRFSRYDLGRLQKHHVVELQAFDE